MTTLSPQSLDGNTKYDTVGEDVWGSRLARYQSYFPKYGTAIPEDEFLTKKLLFEMKSGTESDARSLKINELFYGPSTVERISVVMWSGVYQMPENSATAKIATAKSHTQFGVVGYSGQTYSKKFDLMLKKDVEFHTDPTDSLKTSIVVDSEGTLIPKTVNKFSIEGAKVVVKKDGTIAVPESSTTLELNDSQLQFYPDANLKILNADDSISEIGDGKTAPFESITMSGLSQLTINQLPPGIFRSVKEVVLEGKSLMSLNVESFINNESTKTWPLTKLSGATNSLYISDPAGILGNAEQLDNDFLGRFSCAGGAEASMEIQGTTTRKFDISSSDSGEGYFPCRAAFRFDRIVKSGEPKIDKTATNTNTLVDSGGILVSESMNGPKIDNANVVVNSEGTIAVLRRAWNQLALTNGGHLSFKKGAKMKSWEGGVIDQTSAPFPFKKFELTMSGGSLSIEDLSDLFDKKEEAREKWPKTILKSSKLGPSSLYFNDPDDDLRFHPTLTADEKAGHEYRTFVRCFDCGTGTPGTTLAHVEIDRGSKGTTKFDISSSCTRENFLDQPPAVLALELSSVVVPVDHFSGGSIILLLSLQVSYNLDYNPAFGSGKYEIKSDF